MVAVVAAAADVAVTAPAAVLAAVPAVVHVAAPAVVSSIASSFALSDTAGFLWLALKPRIPSIKWEKSLHRQTKADLQGLFRSKIWNDGQIDVHKMTVNMMAYNRERGSERRSRMSGLNASMRLKVKRDSFFFPESDGSVYFRNNIGTFRMEGSMMQQWVEMLMPMFNGEHTLEELTDGLPQQYRDRVFDIAKSLYQNGFVRDVSQDRPHQPDDRILQTYGAQMEFLNEVADSGAYRFMCYRQAKVLAIGSGAFLVSLISALLDSGLPTFHYLITDAVATNRGRVEELAEHARRTDPDVAIEELAVPITEIDSWRQAVQAFDWIVYTSQSGDLEELQLLDTICKEEGKWLLPALLVHQVGLAGPLAAPDAKGFWESAWRRLHQPALFKDSYLHSYSPTAGAMLANVTVFELFKKVTAVSDSELENSIYLLKLETLEGNWHTFLPHPLVGGLQPVKRIEALDQHLEEYQEKDERNGLIHYFGTLTSTETGIFHIWDEEELTQLPLAQCRIQAVDPLTEGPAELLPAMVCTGLTHEEARKEAGLAGIEAYVSRMVGSTEWQGQVGVGAGETVAEGVCRGLQAYLYEEGKRQLRDQMPTVRQVQLGPIEDERCQFYMKSLTMMQGTPVIGLGREVCGFPVVWVGSGGRWHGSVGLNLTFALRKSLQQALCQPQNKGEVRTPQTIEVDSVHLVEGEQRGLSISIPTCKESMQTEDLQSAMQVLKAHGKRLELYDLAQEPFLKEELAGVYGVLLREEESS